MVLVNKKDIVVSVIFSLVMIFSSCFDCFAERYDVANAVNMTISEETLQELREISGDQESENTSSSNVTDAVIKALNTMEPLFLKSYDNAKTELISIINQNSYDYGLTMSSFYDNTNPYKNCDYYELIAACVLIVSENNGYIGGLNLLNISVMPESYLDIIPVKIPQYKKLKNGKYVLNGEQYIYDDSVVDIFDKDTKKNKKGKDLYIKTGEKIISPQKEYVKYGCVTLTPATKDEIFTQANYDISDPENKELYDNTLRILKNGGASVESISQTISVEWDNDNPLSDKIQGYLSDISSANEKCGKNRHMVKKTALSLLNQIPYLWGGKSKKAGYDKSWWSYNKEGKQKGLDCSGYVQWVYRTAGFPSEVWKNLLSTSSILDYCDRTSESELKIGDLGLSHEKNGKVNHVGIYIGNGYFIHCSSSANTVTITPNSSLKFKVFCRVPNINKIELKDMGNILNFDKNAEYTEDELYLLAQCVAHEAQGEGLNGWIAVTEVILNRVKSPLFDDSIYDVIYAPGQFSYNFEIKDMVPSEELLTAVKKVVDGSLGVLNNENVLFFRNPYVLNAGGEDGLDDWGNNQFYMKINNHVFYTKGKNDFGEEERNRLRGIDNDSEIIQNIPEDGYFADGESETYMSSQEYKEYIEFLKNLSNYAVIDIGM